MSETDFYQKGFGLKAAVAGELAADYKGKAVEAIRRLGSRVAVGPIELHLAKEFGFCYGVDRAIDYAYETRRQFPDRTLYVTNEIIHNPYVNKRLEELGFRFFGPRWGISDVQPGDVVLLPAFGAPVELTERLRSAGAVLVDTTCGSVMNVWKRVRSYAREGITSVVHGKYGHEETIATCSQALAEGGQTIVVRDANEARILIGYMLGRGPSRAQLLARFAAAISPGFDPDQHLAAIGVANQTTMLASESLQISKMFEDAVRERDGEVGLEARFRNFDTICSATQERQDAILEVGRAVPLDLFLVIGGFNSSNTTHLCKIARSFAPAFHIESAGDLLSRDEIRHQEPGSKEPTVARSWLANRLGGARLQVGVTSGASTPNSIVAAVLERLGALHGVALAAELGARVALLPEPESQAVELASSPRSLPLHEPNAAL